MAGQDFQFNVNDPKQALMFLKTIFGSDLITMNGRQFLTCSSAFATLDKVLDETTPNPKRTEESEVGKGKDGK